MSRHLTVGLLVLLAGCAARPGDPVPPEGSPAETHNFYLVVSNQSFQHPHVEVEVRIDGLKVVDRGFDVEAQHAFSTFFLDLEEGNHVLVARADDATYSDSFVIPPGGTRYGTLTYWAHPRKDPYFSFRLLDSPPSIQ